MSERILYGPPASEIRRDPLTAPDPPKRSRAKKDTARWCRGKVGVEHNYLWRPYRSYLPPGRPASMGEEVCSECGKKRGCWFMSWRLSLGDAEFQRYQRWLSAHVAVEEVV